MKDIVIAAADRQGYGGFGCLILILLGLAFLKVISSKGR